MSDVSFETALRHFRRRGEIVVATETVALSQAQGRVLAEDLVAVRAVPPFDNAAVDGFAFRWDSSIVVGAILPIQAGRSAAGHGLSHQAEPGHAVRVLTGAPLPLGTDTVAPFERCSIEASHVQLPPDLRLGSNRRLHGEDFATGSLILARSQLLGPWQIACAAALGLGQVMVHRRVRLALLSTGDEILPPGTAWQEAHVFDVNRPLLTALLAGLPVDLVDLGILPDERDRIGALLDDSANYDVVIVSGGASGGDEDHVANYLSGQGRLDFWRVRMRPGRPLALGGHRHTAIVALPGNPVAAATCFLRFVRPLLLAKAGAGWKMPEGQIRAAGTAIKKLPGRTELVRCRLVAGDTCSVVHPLDRQGSGLLSTLLEADGIAELDATRCDVVAGEPLRFFSWSDFGVVCSTHD